ncbi:MAG: type II secretion system secretin GspD [Pseudomonadota bacterium]
MAGLLALSVPLAAQQTLNIRDADIRAFIQDAARVTGRTFIIDNRVQGKVSVVTDRPLSRSEYFEVFLSTLRANGLVAVPTGGGAYRIQPVEGAAGQAGAVGRAVNRNQFVTEVFRLRNIDAATTLETLRPLVSKDGSVTANRAGNSLVVADYADNVNRVRQLIGRLDRSNDATQVVTLRNASAREIATSLQALASAGGTGGAPGGTAASVVPVDSANAIAIRGDPATVSRLAAVARELDRKAQSGAEIRVYWLEHADAEKLVPVLQQLLGQPVTQSSGTTGLTARSSGFLSGNSNSGSGGNSAPVQTNVTSVGAATSPVATGNGATVGGGNGIVTRGPAIVTRFEGANAIVLAANVDVQRQLGDVIRQLDTRRDQVLVEAIIVEIGDAAARRLGVQFLIGSTKAGFAATRFSNASPDLLTLAGGIAATQVTNTTSTVSNGVVTSTTTPVFGTGLQDAAIQSLLNATGGFGGVATQLGKNGILGAIINAVRSDSDSNLLSSPSVTTMDNQQASLLAGQEVPVTTGEALSSNFDNQFRTVQRQNVGVQLDVKPQINAGGTIKLAIRQEVSSIAGPVSVNSTDLIINKRELQTTVTVDDGEILVLGGLLDENERRTIEKIPFLGDIPVLGNLFRSKARSRSKSNLMIFIRPTILRSADDARRLTEQRYGYMRAQQMYGDPTSEPSLDTLVRDYMGAIPPGAMALPTDPTAGAVVVTPATDGPVTVTPPPGGSVLVPSLGAPIPVIQTNSTSVVRPVEIPPSKAERRRK